MISTPTLENINTEDGLNFMNIVNSSSKPLNDGTYFSYILMQHIIKHALSSIHVCFQ